MPCFQSRPARSDQTWTSRTSPMTPAWIHSLVSREPFGGVPLVAHLRRDACRLGGLGQLAALVQRVRQRLLAVDVLAGPDRRHRGDGVDVVGRADRDGVDVLGFLVEHLAEVLVSPRLREGLERAGRAVVVDVAQGDDVGAELADVAMSPPPMPPQPMPATLSRSLGGVCPGPPKQHMPRDDREAESQGGRGCEKVAAGFADVAARDLLLIMRTPEGRGWRGLSLRSGRRRMIANRRYFARFSSIASNSAKPSVALTANCPA